MKKVSGCLLTLCAAHMEPHVWTSTASVALAHGMSVTTHIKRSCYLFLCVFRRLQ